MANHVHKRVEQNQHPHHTENVEEHVSQSRAPSLRTCRKRRQVRSDRRTDVFAHHKRNALVNREHAARAEDKRNGHDGSRRLHTHRKDAAQKQEQKRAPDAVAARRGKEINNRLVMRKVHRHSVFAERRKPEEHKREAEHEFAKALDTILADIREHDSKPKERPNNAAHVELESEDGHEPSRCRRTDICAHNNRNGLLKSKQASIHKTNSHDGSRSRRLHSGSNGSTRKKSTKPMLGHSSKNRTEVSTSKLLQAFTHRLHAKHKESEATDHLENHKSHRSIL